MTIPAIQSKWIRITALFLVLLTWSGCDSQRTALIDSLTNKEIQEKAMVEQAVWSALSEEGNPMQEAWLQFVKRWPEARRRIGFAWYAEQDRYEGEVVGVALVEDRYVFKAILSFRVNAETHEVEFDQVRFHFTEVKKVILPASSASGGVMTYFESGQTWFGLDEWKAFESSGWEFGSIGLRVVTNSPVPNIRSALPNL